MNFRSLSSIFIVSVNQKQERKLPRLSFSSWKMFSRVQSGFSICKTPKYPCQPRATILSREEKKNIRRQLEVIIKTALSSDSCVILFGLYEVSGVLCGLYARCTTAKNLVSLKYHRR